MTGPLQALAARYDRLAAKGEVPVRGFSMQKISYAIVLSGAGEPVDVEPLLDTDGRKPVPRSILVPQAVKRTSGIAANFLWDKTSYVLGVTGGPGRRLVEEHAAFKALHEDILSGSSDEGVTAFLTFLCKWAPVRFAAAPFQPAMLDANVVFRLDGDEHDYIHERPAARAIWLARLASADAPQALCLVTGVVAPIARLHPAIKGVAGAQSSGASLVSFNLDAFTSYGNEQGANAPVAEAAAFGYGTVLNQLLAKGSRNVVGIGDATAVFWADVPEAETVVASLFDPPAPDAKGETKRIREALEAMAAGRPMEETGRGLDPATRFYLLGLAPNAARLSVRFWHESTLGDLARRFQEHWRDLRIDPEPWRGGLPAMWALLYELAPQRTAENVPAHLAGELTRAIVTGGRYPGSLLATLVMRMRADRDVNGRRVSLVKACLVRELRLRGTSPEENHLVSLDPDDLNPGYRLGRLFAVLENVQRGALGKSVNATIRDRYYGAASATPAAVFPVLIRTSAHHLASMRKAGRGGLAFTLDQEMGRIIDGLGAALPRSLRIEDQGRFAIGYYHERFGRQSALPVDDAADDDTDTQASED